MFDSMFDMYQTYHQTQTFDKLVKIMSERTTFRTIFEDLKESLEGAGNHMLSYFLANLGMIVFIVFALAIVAVPILGIIILVGPEVLASLALNMTGWSLTNPWSLTLLGVIVILPFVALGFMYLGSLFGMSKEVVETGTTKAESAFSWLRHNFLSFAGAGVVLTLIVVLPQALVVTTISYLNGYTITGWVSFGVSLFVFVYSFITLGLTSMVLPAIVNGKGVQDAFFESYKLATERFDRVFGVHTAIVLLGLLMFSPILGLGVGFILYPALTLAPLVMIAIALWTVFAVFLWLILLLPMSYIAYTRVYHDLTGVTIAQQTRTTPEVPMV